jgi:hypothetical protein
LILVEEIYYNLSSYYLSREDNSFLDFKEVIEIIEIVSLIRVLDISKKNSRILEENK